MPKKTMCMSPTFLPGIISCMRTFLRSIELYVQKGCSEIGVRRFFAHHSIFKKGHVSKTHLEIAISRAINQQGYVIIFYLFS